MTAPQAPNNPYGLLRAAEAVTNLRALATMGLAALAVFLCAAAGAWMTRSSVILGVIMGLLTLVVAMAGYSSVGIMLMRHAQGVQTSIVEAFMQALLTLHRLLGVALLMLLVFLGMALAALLLLLVCKLPGVGNLLYAVMFPIITLILGLTIAGMCYVAFPLAAPAVWAGNTIWQTAARLFVIIRQRLLFVITNLVMLSLLVFFLSSVVMFVLYSGYFATIGLSAKVGINVAGGMGSLMSSAMGGMSGGMSGLDGTEGMSYGGAFAFASGLVFMLGMTIPFLTFINGSCLIYLQTVDGLDFDAAEEQLRGHVDEAKRRAQEARERAGAKLDEAKAAAAQRQARAPFQAPAPTPGLASSPAPTQAPAPTSGPGSFPAPTQALAPVAAPASVTSPLAQSAPVAPARSCISCHEPLAADDIFCGGCGTKNPL